MIQLTYKALFWRLLNPHQDRAFVYAAGDGFFFFWSREDRALYILNFSHPLTDQNLAEVRRILAYLPDEPITVLDIPTNVDRSIPIPIAAHELLKDIPWDDIGDQILLVNPPGLAPVALTVMNELRSTHDSPDGWLNVRPVNAVAGVSTRYEVAEVIDCYA